MWVPSRERLCLERRGSGLAGGEPCPPALCTWLRVPQTQRAPLGGRVGVSQPPADLDLASSLPTLSLVGRSLGKAEPLPTLQTEWGVGGLLVGVPAAEGVMR